MASPSLQTPFMCNRAWAWPGLAIAVSEGSKCQGPLLTQGTLGALVPLETAGSGRAKPGTMEK